MYDDGCRTKEGGWDCETTDQDTQRVAGLPDGVCGFTFVSKLSDAEGDAAETQVWIEFAVACQYLQKETGDDLDKTCDHILGKIVNMINHPEDWML